MAARPRRAGGVERPYPLRPRVRDRAFGLESSLAQRLGLAAGAACLSPVAGL